ncbi:MAG: ABC transporter permease [Clostridiaceae bacterium]
MTRTKRGLWRAVLPGLLAAICWLIALTSAVNLVERYGGLSVRFAEAAVTRADLERAQTESTGGGLVLQAAWTRSSERQTLGSALGGSAKVRVVGVYGDPRQTAFIQLLCGGFLPEDDEEGCVLDAASAWALFHSTDAVGAMLTLNGKTYAVRGVAEAYEPMILIRDDSLKYENLEFGAEDPASARQEVETFVTRCGAGGDFSVVQSGLYARLALGLTWFPACGLLVAAAAGLLKKAWLQRENKRAWPLLLAAGTALLAAAVLLLIKTFYWPQSFLPTKWSDFAFWRALIEGWQADWKATSLMTPLPKDIQLFRALRQCAVLMLTALLTGGWSAALFCATDKRQN